MPDTFRITLKDTNGFEHLDHREFDLPLGSTFPIGRASKNTSKKDLMPAVHNAYIDSPVVSREHALLSATDSREPHVFIMDTTSMHGTMVNGEKLTPNSPRQLSPGDMLQFGVDVNRNDEYFTARKFTFGAHLSRSQPPFSLGFTVPDSEGEEIGGTTPRRGSQSNPLTISESDSESDISDNEQSGFTATSQCIIHIDDELAVGSSINIDSEPAQANDILVAEVNFSENEGSTGYYSSDQEDNELDMDSGASAMDESEVDYNSDLADLGESDMENEDMDETVAPQTDAEPQCSPAIEQANIPEPPNYSSQNFFNVMESNSGPLPPMNIMRPPFDGKSRQTWDSNVFANSFPPPLPPRPAPSMLDRTDIPSASTQGWFTEDLSAPPSLFNNTYQADRPMLFEQVPVMPTVPVQEPVASETAPMLYVQTPPPMPSSEAVSSTPPPPSRRTKVSITEIVEDQPPTPTSINSMKRKAEVFDEDEEILEKLMIAHFEGDVTPAVTETTIQTAAEIAQRPKLQPRSIISKVRNTATYLGYSAVGAVSAVALLSYLPDAFFA